MCKLQWYLLTKLKTNLNVPYHSSFSPLINSIGLKSDNHTVHVKMCVVHISNSLGWSPPLMLFWPWQLESQWWRPAETPWLTRKAFDITKGEYHIHIFHILNLNADWSVSSHWLVNWFALFGAPYMAHDIYAMYLTHYYTQKVKGQSRSPQGHSFRTVKAFLVKEWILVLHHLVLIFICLPITLVSPLEGWVRNQRFECHEVN